MISRVDRKWKNFVKSHDRMRKSSAPYFHSRWGRSEIMNKHASWLQITPIQNNIPAMLTLEEIKYLTWISTQIKPSDSLVELGPWLGASTQFLLSHNNNELTVVDDFIWRSSWMDSYINVVPPTNHSSFKNRFIEYNSNLAHRLLVKERQISLYDGNDNVRIFESGDLPETIDVILVDCGRTFEVNQKWWEVCESRFIPGETLIIMQDWRLWREVPKTWYNQTLEFYLYHQNDLKLIHEVNFGGLAAFIYKGDTN